MESIWIICENIIQNTDLINFVMFESRWGIMFRYISSCSFWKNMKLGRNIRPTWQLIFATQWSISLWKLIRNKKLTPLNHGFVLKIRLFVSNSSFWIEVDSYMFNTFMESIENVKIEECRYIMFDNFFLWMVCQV